MRFGDSGVGGRDAKGAVGGGYGAGGSPELAARRVRRPNRTVPRAGRDQARGGDTGSEGRGDRRSAAHRWRAGAGRLCRVVSGVVEVVARVSTWAASGFFPITS